MANFFRREEVIAKTGVSDTTLDRWSKTLRPTHMVVKPAGGRVLYTSDFVTFIAARVRSQGPSNLPSASRIAAIFRAMSQCGENVDCIAARLGVNAEVVLFQIMSIGLEFNQESDATTEIESD